VFKGSGGFLKRRNRTGELVVKPRYSSGVKLFIAALVVIALIGTGGYMYNHGLQMAGFDRLSVSERQQGLKQEIRKLKDENLELRESLARAQRAIQMDQSAYQELDNALQDSAREIVKLREELSFYRNIISPANKVSGLQIQSLNIDRQRDDEYRYKLVLIQALKHDRNVHGNARLVIHGMQAGKDHELQVPGPNEKALGVNFKYFQEFEGSIKLPSAFRPLRVTVRVQTSGGDGRTVEQAYNWPTL
jgi:hypothetical protein